uniref:3'-5' exonuclease n=1 Tax=Allosalinactinospora lopnorensis TaxID=1352348 RepID=UPI000623C9A2
MGDTWTAIDFETANQDRGSACAVGLVRVADGRIVGRYSTLIRPPGTVDFFSPRNTAIHGITAEDVAAAPRWDDVLRAILDFAGGDPLVAHNAAFDIGVVRQTCGHSGLAWPGLDYACTLALARRTWQGLPDHRLPTVCSRIGHRMEGRHHRADADAEAAARIMVAAMRHYGTHTLGELCGGRGGLPSAG